MKLRTKQISLGALAAVTIVAVPVATVISCGSESKDDSKGEPNPQGTDTATHKIIDLNKINSTTKLFDEIDSIIKNKMPKTAFEMSALDQSNQMLRKTFDYINNYMNGMDTKVQKISFKFNGKTFTWDITELTKTIEDVKSEMKLGYAKVKTSFNFPALISADNPAMSVYVAKQSTEGMSIGMLVGMKLMGFTLLPGKAFDAYTQMLKEYNKLSNSFVSSGIYKEWIKNKEFTLPIGDLLAPKRKTETVLPGKKYDDKNDASASAPVASFKSTEFAKNNNSNFAAQWVFTIMSLY